LKIGEQAVYLARLKGLSEADATARVKEWFIKFEMQSWWGKKVEDLSKGMSQKLQFVTTVLHNPSLIILDEPFSGLDPLNANLIKDEIFNLAQKGATIIFSTHRMEQVEEICDHIILLNKGKKILDGTIHDVKQSFKENIFKVGSDTNAFTNLSNYDHLFSLINANEHQLTIKMKEGTQPNQVLQYLIDQNISLNNFNEVMPSLNDIFIKLVEGKAVAARQFENI
jgi:ABC-2 type transport system ATP-binding protein